MKKMRQYLMASLAIGTLATALLVPATSAAADPPTLNLKATDSLYVYTDGFTMQQKLDLSYTWLDEFTDTYNKYVSHGYRPTWPASLPNDIRNIINSGGSYGIYEVVTTSGRTIEFVGTMDPNATCSVEPWIPDDIFICKTNPGYGSVSFSYFTHNSYGGNGQCQWGNCTSTGMIVYADPVIRPANPSQGTEVFVQLASALPTDYEFYVMNFDITYPTGYTGDIIPTSPPAPKYVAMGDSYSSGEGVVPYESGSDNGSNLCHRSTNAYPRLLQDRLDLDLTAFVACSGAVSDFLTRTYNTQNLEAVQANALSQDTELVTLSIGGNDIGFADTLGACTGSYFAQTCLDAIATAGGKISDPSFEQDLTDTLEDIVTMTGADTQIVVTGYPNLFPDYGLIDSGCSWGNGVMWVAAPDKVSARQITQAEVVGLRGLHDDLNSVIQAAVTNAGAKVHFVDPSIEFIGHEVCGPLSDWVSGVSLHANTGSLESGSYHPNALGQSALADVIEAKLDELN